MSIVIVRDREAAGGGIFHYYRRVAPSLQAALRFVGVGRGHAFYGGGRWTGRLPTPVRLFSDWFRLVLELLRFPSLVHLNPGMDIKTRKSLRRDAVNLLLAKLFGRRVLVFWRGWHNDACGAPEFPGGNAGWMSRAYRLADAHVVLSSRFGDDLHRWGFDRPIHVETTVVGEEILAASPGPRTLPAGCPFRVLYLSRVEEAKGVFEMLDAFALLEAGAPGRFQFSIAGDGPDLVELQARADELGLKSLRFLGYVGGDEKSRCFRDADAFCFLSYTEGMPNAVLEAMAMGLPLVSSDAGGLRDILEEGRTGFIVDYERGAPVRKRFSARQVADRLEALAADPECYEAMSRHNHELARERFAAPRVAARLEAIYREVVGEAEKLKS